MLKMTVKAHLDWVRDVSWNTFIGNEYTLIASCSEVIIYHYIYWSITW